MPKIEPSNKLSPDQEEYRICSEPYVFYRIIVDGRGGRLMTATAGEDIGPYRAYDDQSLLITTTAQVFGDFDMTIATKTDHAARSYIETPVTLDKTHLIHIATTALHRIGFVDVEVLSLRDLLALHDEFAADDSGEDTYLSDGMWVTSDGRLVEK